MSLLPSPPGKENTRLFWRVSNLFIVDVLLSRLAVTELRLGLALGESDWRGFVFFGVVGGFADIPLDTVVTVFTVAAAVAFEEEDGDGGGFSELENGAFPVDVMLLSLADGVRAS